MNIRCFLACVLPLFVLAPAVAEEPKVPLINPELLARQPEQIRSKLLTWVEEFASSPDDALFLEGILTLLAQAEVNPPGPRSPLELLQRLAERQWRAPRDESAADWWNRQQRELEFVPGERLAQYRELREAFQKVHKQPALPDWRAQADFWKDLCLALRGAPREKDLATVWGAKIAADEKHAVLYRRAYAAAAIAAKAELDFELVRPILEPTIPQPADEFLRVAEVLYMLAASKCSPDDPRRVELRTRLPLLNYRRDLILRTEMSCVVQLDGVGGEEQRELRAALVRDLNPQSFRTFAAWAKIPPETMRRLQLSRQTKVAYHGTSLRAVLRELQSTQEIPIWIDEMVLASDEFPIFLEETGPWLAILERVLSQTKYSLVARPSREFWIGPPDRKTAAFATWDRGLAKAAGAKGKLQSALQDPTVLEFIRTPLRDVLDYLSDLHGIQLIVRPVALSTTEISNNRRGLPLYLELELMAEETKLSWEAVGQVAVVGTPAELGRLRDLEARRLRLSAELATRSGPAGERLLDATTLEFTKTPLAIVCAYLRDLHGLPVAVAPGDSSRRTLTLDMKGLELGATLDFVALDSGLDWSSDGDAIYLGSKAEVAEFLMLRKERERKRAKYPAEIAAKMQKPVKVAIDDATTLGKAAAALGKQIGLAIELPADDAELGKTPLRAARYTTPADVALDLLCLAHGLAWEATEKGVRIGKK